MKISTLGRLLGTVLLCAAFAARAGAAPDVGDEVTPLGDNTFSITKQAGTTFTRSSDKLKYEVQQEANDYCTAQGKVIKVVSLSGKVPTFGLGYASAKIVFKALAPGDPELATGLVQATNQVPVNGQPPIYVQVPTYVQAPPPPAAPKQLTTDDLYANLMKLDDLRKKGILTDEEFQAEKKKLLSHTN